MNYDFTIIINNIPQAVKRRDKLRSEQLSLRHNHRSKFYKVYDECLLEYKCFFSRKEMAEFYNVREDIITLWEKKEKSTNPRYQQGNILKDVRLIDAHYYGVCNF